MSNKGIELYICGDVCLTPDAFRLYESEGHKRLFSDRLVSILNRSDGVVINLECPLTDNNQRILKSGPNHKTPTAGVQVLNDIAVSHASIANNHILDYGIDGMRDTYDALRNRGISVIGSTYSNGCICNIVDRNGIKVGFVSFADDEFNGLVDETGPISLFDPLNSFDTIRELRDQCDIAVVQYHSGLEHYEYPTPYLQRVCRKMVDAGADLVLCQHSHCIGCKEIYQNRYILYGQGNFHFYRETNKSKKWNNSIIIKLSIAEDKNYSVEELFVHNTDGLVDVNSSPDGIKEVFENRSKVCSDDKTIKNMFEAYCHKNKEEFVLSYLRGKSNWYYRIAKLTHGRLIRVFLRKNRTILMSNLIRSSVHNEIVREVLKSYNYEE